MAYTYKRNKKQTTASEYVYTRDKEKRQQYEKEKAAREKEAKLKLTKTVASDILSGKLSRENTVSARSAVDLDNKKNDYQILDKINENNRLDVVPENKYPSLDIPEKDTFERIASRLLDTNAFKGNVLDRAAVGNKVAFEDEYIKNVAGELLNFDASDYDSTSKYIAALQSSSGKSRAEADLYDYETVAAKVNSAGARFERTAVENALAEYDRLAEKDGRLPYELEGEYGKYILDEKQLQKVKDFMEEEEYKYHSFEGSDMARRATYYPLGNSEIPAAMLAQHKTGGGLMAYHSDANKNRDGGNSYQIDGVSKIKDLNPNSIEANISYMTENERNIYFALWQREGVAAADVFFDKLRPTLKKRQTGSVDKAVEYYAENDPVFKALGTGAGIGNFGFNVASGAANFLDLVEADKLENMFGSDIIGQASAYGTSFRNLISQTQKEISDNISEDSELGAFFYNLGISAGQFAVAYGASKYISSFLNGTSAGSKLSQIYAGKGKDLSESLQKTSMQLIMSSNASISAIDEAEREGLNKGQAIAYGIAVGVIEAATERFSIEALFSDASNVLGYVVKNIVSEGSEEMASEIASNIADVIINADRSQFLSTVETYIAQGMSDNEARKQAFRNLIKNTLLAGAGGAILGGVFGGGSIVSSAIGNQMTIVDGQIALGEEILSRPDAMDEITSLIDYAETSEQKQLKKHSDKVKKTRYDFGELGKTYTAPAREIGKLAELASRNAAFETVRSTGSESLLESDRNVSDQNPTVLFEKQEKSEKVLDLYSDLLRTRAETVGLDEENDFEEAINDPVSIIGKDEYGKIKVLFEDGTTNIYDENAKTISTAVKSRLNGARYYGENGAKTYFATAPDYASAKFSRDFSLQYESGAANSAFSPIRDSDIPYSIQEKIWQSGKDDLGAAAEKSRKAVAEAKAKERVRTKKQMGFKNHRVTISDAALEYLKSIPDQSVKQQNLSSAAVIDAVAKMLQIDIDIILSEKDEQGEYISPTGIYDAKKDRITLDIAAGMENASEVTYSAMIKTLGHELTHYIQNWNESKYVVLKNETLDFLKKENGAVWVDDQIERIIIANRSVGNSLTIEAARDELVADSFENVLSNVNFAELILKTDKTLFEKIHDWIKKALETFKSNLSKALNKLTSQTAAGRTLEEAGERAVELYEMWGDAFSEAFENSAAKGSETSDSSASVKYQVRSASTAFDTATRRELIYYFEDYSKSLTGNKYKTQAIMKAYAASLDNYDSALLDLKAAQQSGNADAENLAKAELLLRAQTVRGIEKSKVFSDLLNKVKTENQSIVEMFKSKKANAELFTKRAIKESAARLMVYSGARGITTELELKLSEFYNFINENSKNAIDREDIEAKAAPIADLLMANIKHGTTDYSERDKEFKAYIKNQRFYLSEAQKEELEYRYGSFNAFRKEAFGKIYTTQNSSYALESAWDELSQLFPEYINSEVKAEEMPRALLESINNINDSRSRLEKERKNDRQEIKADLITRIYDSYWQIPSRRKTLDFGKYESLFEDASAMIKTLRSQLTEAERSARDSIAKADRAVFRSLQDKMRQSRNELLGRIDKLRNRLKQAINKPTERASVPKGGEKLADNLLSAANTLSELLRVRGVPRSNDELINLVSNSAMAESLGNDSYHGTKVDMVNRWMKQAESLQNQLAYELNDIAKTYESIIDKPTVNLCYSKELVQRLGDYIKENADSKSFGGTLLMEHVRNGITLITAMSHRLMTSNRAMIAGRWVDIIQLRSDLFEDVSLAPKVPYNILNKVSYALTPKTMIHLAFGATENSDTLYSVYDDAQNKYIRYINGAKDLFRQLESDTAKSKLMNNEATIKTGLVDTKGKEVLFNPDLAISFLLAIENEDYLRHMVYGGLLLPDLKRYYSSKSSEAYVKNRFTEHVDEETKIQDYLDEYIEAEDIDAALKRMETQKDITDVDFKIYLADVDFKANLKTKAEYEMREKYLNAAKMIRKQLDPLSLKWLSLIRAYYNGYARELLDEATMERYGFTKTISGKNSYYPIKVVKSQLEIEQNKHIKYDATLESLGSMKSRSKSKLGVHLFGAISSLSTQIEETATYYAWINSLDRAKNVLTSTFRVKDESKINLIKHASKEHGSVKLEEYLNDLELELVGAKRSTTEVDRFLETLHCAFVASALSFNISPALKQTSALPLVAAESGYINMIKGFGKGMFENEGGKRLPIITKAQQEHIAKYSIVYKYRAGGLLNIDLAALKNNDNPISKFLQKYPKATGTAWPELIDAQTLGYQFYALRESVKKLHPDWDSEQINVETGKQLDKTIQTYQANYSLLQRAPLLRGSAAKMLFGTFKSQQITMLNAKIDAILRVLTIKKQIKSGYGDTAKLKVELRRAQKHAAKVSAALAVSYVFNALLAAGISILYRRKEWDDETLLSDIGWNILESYLSMLPLIGDVLYYAIEQKAGKGYYGDPVAEIGGIEDLQDALGAINDIENGALEGDLTIDRIAKDFGKLAAPFGIPLRNAYNIIKALLDWFGIELE